MSLRVLNHFELLKLNCAVEAIIVGGMSLLGSGSCYPNPPAQAPSSQDWEPRKLLLNSFDLVLTLDELVIVLSVTFRGHEVVYLVL